MNLKIRYLKKAVKFISKNSHILNEDQANELLLKAAKKNIFTREQYCRFETTKRKSKKFLSYPLKQS